MSFTRSHHQVIAAALGSLNADLLREVNCLFAGGTALALRFGEYRESVDIDFVVADATSYRVLREACRAEGLAALTIPGQRVVTCGALTTDQYGIRCRLSVAGVDVKFEIIREGRILLDQPRRGDEVLGIATSTLSDLMAMKLLANQDRWRDPTVFSRDIIDVAMVRPTRPVLIGALAKAVDAYGVAVYADARSAIARLLDDVAVLERCRRALGMAQPPALLVDRLRRLDHSLTGVGRFG